MGIPEETWRYYLAEDITINGTTYTTVNRYWTADKTKCEQIATQVKRSFPELPVYINFHSPSWKCRAGNFTDYSEAQAVLKQVKAMGYSQACLVKGTIVVR